MQFTTVRSKEKDYDWYLKSAKGGKKLVQPIKSYLKKKKVDPCYLDTKKPVVHICQEQGKRL